MNYSKNTLIYIQIAKDNGKKVIDKNNGFYCSTLEECFKEPEIVFIGTSYCSNIGISKIKIGSWKSGRVHFEFRTLTNHPYIYNPSFYDGCLDKTSLSELLQFYWDFHSDMRPTS